MIRQLVVGSLTRGPIVTDNKGNVDIPGVKFPTSKVVANIDSGKTFKTRFIKERWHWFNSQLFGSAMREPNIILGNDTKDAKVLGSWRHFDRRFLIRPKLFAVSEEKVVLGVIVHEMCHQYESEVTPRPLGEDPHGTTWKHIMASVGMPTSATYKDVPEALHTTQQRRDVERLQSEHFKLTFEYLNKQEASPALWISKARGKITPVMLTNRTKIFSHRKEFIGVAGIKQENIRDRKFFWFPMEELTIPARSELLKFPPDLRGIPGQVRIAEILAYLNANPTH